METIDDYYNLVRRDLNSFTQLVKTLSLKELLFHHFKCSINSFLDELDIIENEIIERFNSHI